jgi:hypothetical protein
VRRPAQAIGSTLSLEHLQLSPCHGCEMDPMSPSSCYGRKMDPMAPSSCHGRKLDLRCRHYRLQRLAKLQIQGAASASADANVAVNSHKARSQPIVLATRPRSAAIFLAGVSALLYWIRSLDQLQDKAWLSCICVVTPAVTSNRQPGDATQTFEGCRVPNTRCEPPEATTQTIVSG